MQINLSPQLSDATLTVVKAGDVLTINGEAFDFSVIPEGATLPASAVACEFVTDEVTRTDGVLSVTLLLPHGSNPSPAVAFPAPLVNPPDGPLVLPADPRASEPAIIVPTETEE